MTSAEYNEEMEKAYKDLKAAAKTSDEEGYPPALQLCFDWYERQEREAKGGYRSTRSISARMKAARDELTTIVSRLHLLLCPI